MAHEKRNRAIEVPDNWDEMTDEEQYAWAEAALEEVLSSE